MSGQLRVFFGQGGGDTLFLGFDSNADDGDSYDLYAECAPVAPAGAAGEAVFSGLYFGLTWDTQVTIRVTPIVDGVAYDGTSGTPDCRITFTLMPADYPGGIQHYQGLLVPLSQPVYDPNNTAIELLRVFLRGTTFACIVETLGGLAASGGLTFDSLELEHEVVSDTKDPVAATVTA